MKLWKGAYNAKPTEDVRQDCSQLRTLFIQAAHVVLAKKPAAARRALWPWVERAALRLAHRNLLATALANKLARIAWAVLALVLPWQLVDGD